MQLCNIERCIARKSSYTGGSLGSCRCCRPKKARIEEHSLFFSLVQPQKILRNSDDRFKNNKTFRVVKIISSEPKNTKVRCDATSLGLDQIQIIWLERTQTREEAEAARTWQRKTMDCVKTSCFLGAKYFQMF